MAILCKVGRLVRLSKLNKNLSPVVDYLAQMSEAQFPDRIKMEQLKVGDSFKINITPDIFVINQKFLTRNPETCLYESHRRYIDFQFMLKGTEQMEISDISNLEIKDGYDSEKDIMFYHSQVKGTRFLLKNNDLAIFFPEDAHRVGMWDHSAEECLKPVIKFPADLW